MKFCFAARSARLLLVVLSFLLAVAATARAQGTVKLGMISSLTGPASSQDQQASIGARMAAEEINASRGIVVGGKKFTFDVVEEDARSRPDMAASAAQKLLNDKDIHVIMGLISSAPGMAAVNLITKADVLYFGGFTALDGVVGKPNAQSIFRTLDQDSSVASGFVPSVVKELGIKKIVAIFPNEDISRSIVSVYKPELERAGVEFAVEYYQPGTVEFFPALRKFQNQGFDTIFLSYPDSEAEGIVRQSLEMGGLPHKFIYRGGSMAPVAKYIGQLDGFAWQILTRDVEHSTDPAVQDWVKKYQKFSNSSVVPTTLWALTYYDTVYMLRDAMEAAGTTTDVAAIAAKLKGMSYKGVRDLRYDNDGRVHSVTDIGIAKGNSIYSVPNKPTR